MLHWTIVIAGTTSSENVENIDLSHSMETQLGELELPVTQAVQADVQALASSGISVRNLYCFMVRCPFCLPAPLVQKAYFRKTIVFFCSRWNVKPTLFVPLHLLLSRARACLLVGGRLSLFNGRLCINMDDCDITMDDCNVQVLFVLEHLTFRRSFLTLSFNKTQEMTIIKKGFVLKPVQSSLKRKTSSLVCFHGGL